MEKNIKCPICSQINLCVIKDYKKETYTQFFICSHCKQTFQATITKNKTVTSLICEIKL